MPTRSFSQQHIVITGGSAGIGLEMARCFAAEGARLSLLARDTAKLDAACAQIAEAGGAARGFSCDVTDATAVQRAFDAACEHFGSPQGIIANSGYCQPGRFDAMSPADLERQIGTNVLGVCYTLREGLPRIEAGGGGFAAVTSSPGGSLGIYGFGPYGASKAALNNLFHALRQEYADRPVTLHLLLPPDTDTPGYAQEQQQYPAETRAILAGGRLYPPDVVARKLVAGIRRGRTTIAAGYESVAGCWAARLAPMGWEWYCRRTIDKCRRAREHKGE
ncbi:MAG: SDR family NAD(P)-dependent oxidoreductase [Candidatus Hydrogenedentota bacterium]